MTDNDLKRRFVILVHDRGFLQPRRKLGPKETARTFPNMESAVKAGMSYMSSRHKEGEVDAVEVDHEH